MRCRTRFRASRNLCHANTIKHHKRSNALMADFQSQLLRGHLHSFEVLPKVFERARGPAPSAILPGMAEQPSIAIVGAGNLGSALAISLRDADFRIDAIITPARAASLA